MGTIWNGMFVRVVDAGTVVFPEWPSSKPALEVTETSVVRRGTDLYCTASTEAKIIARIEEARKRRGEA